MHGNLRIRPLRSGEELTIRELFGRMSPRTRYLRFFSEMPVVPDSLVRMLAEVDDHRRFALVAEFDTAYGSDVVALGNVAIAEDRAEIGIVVADAWQRQGIGVALIDRLMQTAEARGWRRFVVSGLWENLALRRLLNHVADVESTMTHQGVMEISFVRRRPAAPHPPALAESRRKTDWMEQAYERILARGRESAKRRDDTCL
jgi:GNAT superfamily N-acetyltransferase